MAEKTKLSKKKPVLYAGLILFVICAVSGLLLSLTYEFTKEQISAKQEQVSLEAFKQVLPDGYTTLEPLEVSSQFTDIEAVYYSPGNGYCMKLNGLGYKGDPIDIVIGINEGGYICGIVILSHSETPGLGSNITKPSFLNQFIGKNCADGLVLVKADQGGDNEIDAITGATKSSTGVVNAVNQAMGYYTVFLREEEIPGGEAE